MAENSDQELWESADGWKAAAIALAIGTPCVCAFFFPWVYASASDGQMLQRVQIVGSLAAFGVALVTFCTVVWRGLISTQQAKLQRLQIDKLSIQIAATDENNLAALLQKGAELIADVTKPGPVGAGLATLQAVVTAPNAKFAIEAMNLVADYIQTHHSFAQTGVAYQSAAAVLQAGEKIQRKSDRILRFEESQDDEWEFAWWYPIHGVRKVIYRGGHIFPADFPTNVARNARFEKVAFVGGGVSIDGRFVGCSFERCRIEQISERDAFVRGKFKDCDFSGAKLSFFHEDDLRDLQLGRNYFLPTSPPVFDGEVDWTVWLNTEAPPDDEIPF
ncbi:MULTISPECIES: hypothetical protein [unclassified Mesorhizobium]|uniref:hypothetical protein n=1 Tax=unclassified Mesorhizobium TaxID=325217 RepID=UPI00112E51A0|nr:MULTISPECIES: hypothetical protein [unclassified Mesorhizobium]TPN43587.1 hypothetical protein FJ978_30700 [Mesorhizobium sp. B1-1-7]TPN46343.1 hypothetical protein FJ976_22575 [Mesorhizobium sp. B1-1-9]